MPKVVDQNERKQVVAEAVWAVVARLGFKGATIRNVADECDMSVGSIQHYFGSQDDLYRFSMDLIVDRASKRVSAQGSFDPKNNTEAVTGIIELLQELLPLDEERRIEAHTWLAFSAEAISNQDLRDSQERMSQLIRKACSSCLVYLNSQNILLDKSDIEYETERLFALVDGLALHLMFSPSGIAGDKTQDVLRKHILSLVR